MAQAFGTHAAIKAGTRKIPLPITFDTMMDTPSNGPRRRVSDRESAGGAESAVREEFTG